MEHVGKYAVLSVELSNSKRLSSYSTANISTMPSPHTTARLEQSSLHTRRIWRSCWAVAFEERWTARSASRNRLGPADHSWIEFAVAIAYNFPSGLNSIAQSVESFPGSTEIFCPYGISIATNCDLHRNRDFSENGGREGHFGCSLSFQSTALFFGIEQEWKPAKRVRPRITLFRVQCVALLSVTSSPKEHISVERRSEGE